MKRYKGIVGSNRDGGPALRVVIQILEPYLVEGVEGGAALQPKLEREYGLPHHKRHSPDGHSWGYLGSGCAELALDILWDHLNSEPPPHMYQAFKEEFVAKWPLGLSWDLDAQEVDHWVYTFRGRCERCPHSWGEHIIVQSVPSGTTTVRCPVPGCDCEGSWSATGMG